MQDDPSHPSNINSWLEDDARVRFKYDRGSVDTSWASVFETEKKQPPKTNGSSPVASQPSAAAASAVAEPEAPTAGAPPPPAAAAPPAAPPAARPAALPPAPQARTQTSPAPELPFVKIDADDQVAPLRGAAKAIADNMAASLTIPTATSQRVIPIKVIDENRRLLNQIRQRAGLSKLSYTHLIAWAIVRALEEVPALNQTFTVEAGTSVRVTRAHVNFGLAVDVAGKDGSRSLMVPSIKGAEAMDFAEFVAAFDDIVARARKGKLTMPDFEGTTLSLTNPGTVGTVGSIPRLMPGQGAIIATGAIDYPPEYRGVPEDVRASMGLSKVMTVTCTYDHRVIQGAESGRFLARMQALLEGEDQFYDQLFANLGINATPWHWEADQAAAPAVNTDPVKQVGIARLIDSWRKRGHLEATIDPLKRPRPSHPDLDPTSHGLTIWDLDRNFQAGSFGVISLRTLLDRLRETYAGNTGVQFMHIDDPKQRQWFLERFEKTHPHHEFPEAERRRMLRQLVEAEGFELFLDNRFKGKKRFSLEGGETTITILEELLEYAAARNVDEVVIGMAHRGRLTTLTKVIGKGVAEIFSEFEGDVDSELLDRTGDVMYHLGETNRRTMSNGHKITVSVAANPSHLEAVNPVVEGIVRPKQNNLHDVDRVRVIPLLIHGDAAMAGQGVVAETLNFSQVKGYQTGGTLHLVINNQIGFTTDPSHARSSTYCTDVALGIQAPVMHVNGDDPEACVAAALIAFDYRQKFHRDVVINMICYRKHGHNEGDDASFTQPIMAQQIKEHSSVAKIYASRLMDEGAISDADVPAWQAEQKRHLYDIYDRAQRQRSQFELTEMVPVSQDELATDVPPTAVDRGTLERVLNSIITVPDGFTLHPKLNRFIEHRKAALSGGPVDWALAEALAFGSLLLEGTHVRLSGQDCQRGTFSHRHAVYFDHVTGKPYVPLLDISPDQAHFSVYNSPLSEFGILGFEFGFSVASPFSMVLWEAQYGDFANGAQVIIDQFISSAESKWGQPSGIVLLLPHGQEGGGPEHSSARLERYMQLGGEHNIQVCYPTTPAQYFHLLRRQMRGGPDRRGLRKPLIVMTGKSLLRHPKCVSTLDDLTGGAFIPVVNDPVADPEKVKRVLVCAGKVYYDLVAERDKRELHDTAIVRLPQLYPFPKPEFREMLRFYGKAEDVIWVQEEPRNMGAWPFMRGRIPPLLDHMQHKFGYAGRPESASTAPGSHLIHHEEQTDLIEMAFEPATTERHARKKRFKVLKENGNGNHDH